ncbi:MAG: metalloregulator ArsR/SmtB family transcription factor [Paracoccaceae bacterium]|nr:metalloregulator ArsR/SmtB family transcription factor [Paracoccaceae bacterium]
MQFDSTFAALADPTRLQIVARLAETGEVDATELARPFAISQPAVSRHIKVLEQAGWVTRRRVGTRRPVRLNPQKVDEIHIWTGRLRAALAANYARLDALLDSEENDQ